jgi:hypothetical protein
MRWLIAICAAAAALPAAAREGPVLEVSPSALSFSAPFRGPDPSPGTLSVRNGGTGPARMDWTASEDADWLLLTPVSGRLKAGAVQTVTVSVDVDALPVGTYEADIGIAGAGALRTVRVRLVVSALPSLALSPASLSFSAPEKGPDPAAQAFTVANAGGGILAWTASENADWMGLSPTSGSLAPGGSQQVVVAVASSSRPAGSTSAPITVTAPGSTGSPAEVQVSLTVHPGPVLSVSPESLAFFAAEGGTAPAPRSLTVRNAGGGTLSWSLSDDGPWLAAAPASGVLGPGLAEEVVVSAATSGLGDGTYAAAITFTAAGAGDSPRRVDVALDVSGLPVVAVAPDRLDFVRSGVGALSVTNAGAGTLQWSATDDAPWLALSPVSGSLGAVQSAPVTVTADAAGLAPGVYTALVTVQDPASANTSRTAFVTLEVPSAAASSEQRAGGCGLTGAEVLALLALRRRREGRR